MTRTPDAPCVVAFKPAYVRLVGQGEKPIGVEAALLLCQIEYWTPRATLPEGWFWKTAEEWEEETGLTQWQQETARKRLVAAGLLQTTRKGSKDGKVLYRLNVEVLADCQNRPLTATEKALGFGEKPIPVSAISQIRFWQSAKTLICKRAEESETTSETTHREHTHTLQGTKAHPFGARADSVQAHQEPEAPHPAPKAVPPPPKPTREQLWEQGFASLATIYGASAVAMVRAGMTGTYTNPVQWANRKLQAQQAEQPQNVTGGPARASPPVMPEPTEAEKAAAEQKRQAGLEAGRMAAMRVRQRAREHDNRDNGGNGSTAHGEP